MQIGIDARAALSNNKGGFGVYARNLTKAMVELFPKDTFDLKYSNQIEDEISNCENIKYSKLNFPFNSLWTQIRLPFHFVNYKPDVFLFPYQSVCSYGSLRKVVTVHDLRFKILKKENHFEYFRLNTQLKNIVKYADHIICVSQKTRSDLIKYFSVDDSKISVVYHGADHIKIIREGEIKLEFDYLRKKYGIPRNFFLTVGYTMKHKNIISAVECLSKLLKLGHEINLVIAGPKGNDEKNILEKIKTLNLNKNVFRLPYVRQEDLPYLYFYSKFFLYPSLYEGFGFPILEAMRSGSVVLASNKGSIPEIGGDSIINFDPLEIDDLVHKSDTILSGKLDLQQYIKRGYKRSENFSWNKTALNTFRALQG